MFKRHSRTRTQATQPCVRLSDFAGLLDAPYRHTLPGIQQVMMLGELTVNQALDNLDPAA
jgi:hypothetical protein